MNRAFLTKVKNHLLTEKQALLQQVNQEVSIDTEGDEVDEIQGKLLLELTNQIHARNSTKLAQIDAALHRILDATYGVCQDCGEMIAEKRLLLNPHFQTCVECAEERESAIKQGRG
jgi:DnaK suppressor protein